MEKTTFTVLEVQRLLGLSRNSVYDAIRRREIPSLKIGRRIIVPALAIQQLLENASQKEVR